MIREVRLVIKFETSEPISELLDNFAQFFNSTLRYKVLSGSSSHLATVEINERTEVQSFDLNLSYWEKKQ